MNLTACLFAALELIAPASNETVVLIPEVQRAVLTNETLAAREALFAADRSGDRKLADSGDWRRAIPVTFRWKATAGEKGPWEILLATKPDLSDARQFVFSNAKIDAATGRASGEVTAADLSYTLPYANFEIGARYYWRVAGNLTCGCFGHGRTNCSCRDRKPIVESSVSSFTTEDLAPRWIAIEGGVGNFRDLGGRVGLGGRRVRQGMIYRSQGLNDNSVDGVVKGRGRLTLNDVEYLTETLGIRTDLDLRGPVEVAGMNGISPLGKGVRYVNNSSPFYRAIFSPDGMKTMAKNFREFLDERNYPILIHCIGGADRTGALCYVLNAVLGVTRREIETDWESTFYPSIPNLDARGQAVWNSESHFNAGFGKYGDETMSWNDRVILYLRDCGVTDEEIAVFRAIMLQNMVK